MNKLDSLPCPCCQSIDIDIEEETRNVETSGCYIQCADCGLRTATWSTFDSAAIKWNARPVIDQTTILPPRFITKKDLLDIANEIGLQAEPPHGSFHRNESMYRIANAIKRVINKRVG